MSNLLPKAHGESKSKSGASANELQDFAEEISGEASTPNAPDMPLLQLIIMIRKAEAGPADAWAPFITNELRHIKAAVHLLQTDDIIGYRFGTSMAGAMKLVGILKARASAKDIESRIDGVVDADLMNHLPSRKIARGAFVAAPVALAAGP